MDKPGVSNFEQASSMPDSQLNLLSADKSLKSRLPTHNPQSVNKKVGETEYSPRDSTCDNVDPLPEN